MTQVLHLANNIPDRHWVRRSAEGPNCIDLIPRKADAERSSHCDTFAAVHLRLCEQAV